MFRYTQYAKGGGTERGAMDIAVGDWVQSTYRAPWCGVVVELIPDGGLAVVRQVLSRRGSPIRKQKIVRYHCNWFKKIPNPSR